ncbi:MBL fold metallo-hydrolase [Altererythrobacter xixiisoli]|uniref:MBL fold metallo-hydrolase n=1 Tax=Croceibacterium xixiisoli TaxID=1476466 RepID=A0A6I4TXZ7_9SPHN|nr:MBL fold metallo-hydrolase [Croceibacterium xixiisoli]MXO99233.1 MBL fold metallo-hydrolase [Croceibacterium xixiisoli]
MKKHLIIALLVSGSLSTACVAQPAPTAGAPARPAAAAPRGSPLPPPTPAEHITGNVYKIFGGGGNTLVIVQDAGVVLVDTKMPDNGQAILDEVRKITDKPITTIINTHSHPDHIGSTDFIRAQFPNVRVISSEATKTEITANPQHNPAVVPNETYTGRMTIGEGADRIELYSFGRSHTAGDTFVVVPSARLLFMGDVMAWNMAPFLPAGGAMEIADVVEQLVATVKDVDIVVEGHGHVNDWAGLQRMAKFNRALVTNARAAYDRGDAPGTAVAELQRNPDFAVLLDTKIKPGLEYGNTPLARAHMNVNVAFQEFAGEPVGFGVANGQPLAQTDKHKGSNPADTAPPAAPQSGAAAQPHAH